MLLVPTIFNNNQGLQVCKSVAIGKIFSEFLAIGRTVAVHRLTKTNGLAIRFSSCLIVGVHSPHKINKRIEK